MMPGLAVANEAMRVRPKLVLAICCMSLLIVGMDVTIVNVALPSIQRSLGASVSSLQWATAAYTVVLASLLMALVTLVRYELGRDEPLIELRFFASRPFAAASIIAVAAFTAFGGFLFVNTTARLHEAPQEM